jgi:biopolymer transport protein ExbD
MINFERKKNNKILLNLAPLVDVIFLLLLFFMLTSHFILEPAIKISLPRSKTLEAKSSEAVKTISITEEGKIYFIDKEVDLTNIQTVIQMGIDEKADNFIRIKADRGVKLGLIVKVIDEIKLAGVRNFSIVTERIKNDK